MKRFPLRTQLLMVVALLAFTRLWCVTHPARRPAARAIPVTVLGDGGLP